MMKADDDDGDDDDGGDDDDVFLHGAHAPMRRACPHQQAEFLLDAMMMMMAVMMV